MGPEMIRSMGAQARKYTLNTNHNAKGLMAGLAYGEEVH